MIDPADEKFISDLQREDDVGLVLRAHLHVEHQLVELITSCIPFAERCDWSKVPYGAKVEIAFGCGCPKDTSDLLRAIGKLRNDFAHKVNASLTRERGLKIYNSLSGRLRRGVKLSYSAMGLGHFSGPASLDPRDLVILLLLTARQSAKAATHALRQDSPNSSLKRTDQSLRD